MIAWFAPLNVLEWYGMGQPPLQEGETCVDNMGDFAGAWQNCPVEQQTQ
jgi:hypothetical protein